MNLREATALFLATYDNPHTRKAYATAINALRDFTGPDRPVEKLNITHIIEYDNHLRSRGLAEATVHQRRKSIKTFLGWLHEMELTEKYLGKPIKAGRLRRRQSRDKAMTDEEFNLLRDYFERQATRQINKPGRRWNHVRNHAIFLLMGDSGCRIGGAASLLVDDLDLTERTALLTEKGSKDHRVTFGHAAALALRQWLLVRPPVADPHVFVVDTPGGGINPIPPEAISLEIRRACRALQSEGVKIRVLSGHSIRHRKGHQLADAGVSPSIAATALGHEDITTTLNHYYPDDWETARKEIEKLAEKPRTTRFPRFSERSS